MCAFHSLPPGPQSPPSLRLLSLSPSPSPLSLRCPCVKCQTLLSGQRRRHLRCRRRQFPAVFSRPPSLRTLHSPHSALHSPLCPLFGGFICVGGKVSRRLVSPLFPCPFIPCSAHTILLCYVFCLFCIICCLCPVRPACPAVALLPPPTNFTYIYSDILQPLLLLCISYEIVYFSAVCVCVCEGLGVSVCVVVKCFHAANYSNLCTLR